MDMRLYLPLVEAAARPHLFDVQHFPAGRRRFAVKRETRNRRASARRRRFGMGMGGRFGHSGNFERKVQVLQPVFPGASQAGG